MLTPLKDLARQVTKAPANISIDDIEAARRAGWSDQTIEDVIAWACMLQVYSNLDLALGFKRLPESAMNEIAVGTVEASGYLPAFGYFVSMAAKAA